MTKARLNFMSAGAMGRSLSMSLFPSVNMSIANDNTPH